MKALMLPSVAFLVFFALGSGAGAYTTKPALADSTHADTAHADTAHAGAAHAGASKSDTSSHGAATLVPNHPASDSATPANDPHAADSAHEPASPTATTTPAATVNGAVPSHTAPRPTGTRDPSSIASLVRAQTGATVTLRPDGSIGPERSDTLPDYTRMASLLAKMGAREAARTLEQLNSRDAVRALAAMSDRQAALVLAQLTPDQAASLLQASLALPPRTVAP